MRSVCLYIFRILIVLILSGFLVSCRPAADESAEQVPDPHEGVLATVGSQVVTRDDLDLLLRERYAGRSDDAIRQRALNELTQRAVWSQAAIEAGLEDEPIVRAETARILKNRLREKYLFPIMDEMSKPVPEERLLEIYNAQAERFLSEEKRQVAVLWLNPGADPERKNRYVEKLSQARAWFLDDSDLVNQPEVGFSVLSVDYSEHAASRYRGGILGWIERTGAVTDWEQVVSEIAFSLEKAGQVSEVIDNLEGIFLVRLMDIRPAMQRSFESVRDVLERQEQTRLREEAEADFLESIMSRYPIEIR